MSKRTRVILYRLGAVLLLCVIAAVMLRVGRGHTVYFDNKSFEYEGKSYPYAYRMTVKHRDEQIAKLGKRERGMATWIGQDFEMQVDVVQEKGAEPVSHPIRLKLPYSMDGIVVNLPAMLAGLPQEVYASEFIPSEPEGAQEEEALPAEEAPMPADI